MKKKALYSEEPIKEKIKKMFTPSVNQNRVVVEVRDTGVGISQ